MIHREHRGRGLSKFLVQCMIAHPAVAPTRMILGTRDAHGLYDRFGFVRREMMWRPGPPVRPTPCRARSDAEPPQCAAAEADHDRRAAAAGPPLSGRLTPR